MSFKAARPAMSVEQKYWRLPVARGLEGNTSRELTNLETFSFRGTKIREAEGRGYVVFGRIRRMPSGLYNMVT